jgi:hypothetical protein
MNTLKKTAAGAFSSDAMERETIKKNRVSPKNDRSRINFFNIIVFIAIIGSLIVSCNPEEELLPDETGETSDNAISLPEDDYVDGAITSAMKEQWFKFTATASTHYIHVYHGTLSDISVQLYDSEKNAVDKRHDYHQSQLNGYGGWYSEITVTQGKKYYLKVTSYSGSGFGTYRIKCNTTILSTESRSKAKILTANTWVTGTITTDKNEVAVNLYKFTATTATTHYIHIKLGTLTQVYARLYDSNGSILVDRTSITKSGYIPYQYLTNGSVYYVSLWSTSNTGTYQIAFNTSTKEP